MNLIPLLLTITTLGSPALVLAGKATDSSRMRTPGVFIETKSSELEGTTPVPSTIDLVWFQVFSVCQLDRATFSVIRDPSVNTLAFDSVKWEMGDATNSTYRYYRPLPPVLNDGWMTEWRHAFAQAGLYNVKMTIYYDNPVKTLVYTKQVQIYVKPSIPVGPDTLDYCLGSGTSQLSVTPSPSHSLIWYAPKAAPASGWDVLPTAPTPTTGSLGEQRYYVSQKYIPPGYPAGCESDMRKIIVMVVGSPDASAMTTNTWSTCEDGAPKPLNELVSFPPTNELPYRTQLTWYNTNNTGETGTLTPPVPATNNAAVPGRSYYVALSSTIGCGESGRKEIKIIIHPKPTPPAVPAVNLCLGQPAPTLPSVNPTAGHTLRWYGTQATGGAYTNTPQSPTVVSIGTTNYYVSQYFQYTPTIGCESPRAAIAVTVNPLPTANLTGNATVCQNAASPLVAFEGSGGTLPYTFRYSINGATQPTATQTGNTPINVPVATGTAGPVRYDLIDVTDGLGCVGTVTRTVSVTVLPKPDATLTGPADGCAASSKSLTFSGSLGTAPYTFSYTIDGISQSDLSGNSVTLPMSTAVPGTQTYTLRKVSYTVAGITCHRDLSIDHVFKVLPSPILDVSILGQPGKTLTLCQNSPSPTVQLSITDGQAPYTVRYRYQANPMTVPVPAGMMALTFPVATAALGTHEFELVEISDAKGCNRTYSNDKATVTILATPDASISGTTSLCMYAGTAPISFTGTGGTAPFSFTYTLNGGSPLTVSSSAGSANATLQAPSNVTGSFVYQLQSVSYTSGITCSKPVTGSATVTINPSPALPMVTDAAFCQGTTGATLPAVTPVAGTTLRWYGTSATGGSWAPAPPLPPTGTAGLSSYYVSQFNPTTGCEGQRAAIQIRIHPLPEAVLSPGAVVCQSSPDPQLTLTGSKSTSPYTFAYRINGGTTLNAVTRPGHRAPASSSPPPAR